MPLKYAPKPDKISARIIRCFNRMIDELDADKESTEKEKRRFKAIYSSVIHHAMKRRGQTRREAHRYALRTYVESAPKWAGNVLKKKSKSV